MRKANLLSIVVPCHNEEEVLAHTHSRLTAILADLSGSGRITDYEIVYIDNGSIDNTLGVMKNIFASDPRAKAISLRRNFGYQGSISAGLSYAKGDAVVTIDADLQDPPEKIAEMVDFYNEGYDLVLGVRADRSSDSFLKRFFSENYYRLIKILGVEIVHNHGDFRLMDQSLVEEFNDLSERNRFIRGMILQLDSKYALVHYVRQSRTVGKSKFNLSSLVSLSLDGVISFSYVPLRFASLAGLFACLLALAGVCWVFYLRITTSIVPGWASTMLPILVLGGLQMLMLGMIGEYIGRLYIEVKQRPVFLVRKEYIHEK